MSVSIESELGFLAYYQPTGLDRKEVFAFLMVGNEEFVRAEQGELYF